MSTFLTKINIDGYEINQPFIHESYELHSANNKIRLDHELAIEHGFNFIEYIIVVFNHFPEKSSMLLQANGMDLWERQDLLIYNKIFPLQCENLYDEETNALLKHVVRNRTNIALLPFRTEKGSWLLDITPTDPNLIPNQHISNLTLRIYNLIPLNSVINIDIYMKLSNANSQNIDNFNYLHI
jgi:hypothetical protein